VRWVEVGGAIEWVSTMNVPLVVATALAVSAGAAHSYLGERFILIPLFRRPDLPRFLGSERFTPAASQ
jgi:hypothetical protein